MASSKPLITIALLALGASVGATLRYTVAIWASEQFDGHFPYGTLFVNVGGSVLLGLFMTLVALRSDISSELRVLIATGFCGSLTTFSTFSYETVTLLNQGHYPLALTNVIMNVLLTLAGVVLGSMVARLLVVG